MSHEADTSILSVHFEAVRQSSYDMVSSLIMGGAFVEQVCLTKWTATHEAAKVSQSELFQILELILIIFTYK